ncbi:MAG: hypothetical protein UDG28_05115 [Prevotellamassilia sp.]|nr:hypothetical protein [Prevotellamassilia sp.]
MPTDSHRSSPTNPLVYAQYGSQTDSLSTLSPDELDSLLTKINAPALQWTDEPKLIDVVVTIKPLVCA